MERYLDGRRAIVTGGMRGIGLGIARRLTDRGASVVLWDQNIDPADLARHGVEPELVQQVDVASAADVRAAFAAAVAETGPIDILVNNAGINGPVTPSWEYPVEAWERVVGIDLNGVFFCCRAAIPHMRERGYGRIINIASIAGKEGVQFISAYSAAKGGVIAFSKAIAVEPVSVSYRAVLLGERLLPRPMTALRTLVIGGGAIGLAAALVLRARNARTASPPPWWKPTCSRR